MSEYVVELFRGEAPGSVGVELGLWQTGGRQLDEDTWAWLREQGYSLENPDLWVNIRSLPEEEFAPNNRPLASRVATL